MRGSIDREARAGRHSRPGSDPRHRCRHRAVRRGSRRGIRIAARAARRGGRAVFAFSASSSAWRDGRLGAALERGDGARRAPSLASATMPIAGRTMRVISTGSRSTRISLRFASVPQRVCGWLSRVPIASTTSALSPQFVAGEQVLRQIMPVADDALAAGIGDDRRLQPLGERQDFRRRPRPRRCRHRSAALWRRRAGLAACVDQVGIGFRRPAARRPAAGRLTASSSAMHVERHFQRDRARPAVGAAAGRPR